MYLVITKLRSATRYMQRQAILEPRGDREGADEHEKRCWSLSAHYNENGNVIIPAGQFTAALQGSGDNLKLRIPSKGTTTYARYIGASVLCMQDIVLPLTKETLSGVWHHVSADGTRGRGKRVWRCFPTVDKWEGQTEWVVYDDIITPAVFEQHLQVAGLAVGVGCWRPSTRGSHGRFEVVSCEVLPMT